VRFTPGETPVRHPKYTPKHINTNLGAGQADIVQTAEGSANSTTIELAWLQKEVDSIQEPYQDGGSVKP
jgi:hypothetical protein